MAALTDFSRLCIHTITTRPWSIEEAIDKYAAAGVSGITVWRSWLEGRDPAEVGRRIREAGLEVVSLCRGGFFPAINPADRQTSIDDNRRAIDEAAALGAPLIVLVCGADPGQSLEQSRLQIVKGINSILDQTAAAGVRLAIEPLHPMYADTRSAINDLATANQVCDLIDSPSLGVAVDVYHLWWDPTLEQQIKISGDAGRIFAYHVCDWKTPTVDMLNDRGLMGEGCIALRQIRTWVEQAGFDGPIEVEIFSERYWAEDQDAFLKKIQQAYLEFV
jgi:sugar phosphate isomerase/epimerase